MKKCLVQAVGASKRVFELLDRRPRQPPAGDAKPTGSPEGGDVVFDNVWCAPVLASWRGLSPHWKHARHSCVPQLVQHCGCWGM